jgi:hypothetical protein
MTAKSPIKRTPVTRPKQPRKNGKAGKLRPSKTPDRKVTHAVWSLRDILMGDLDRRLTISRQRDQIESQWIDHAGGQPNLTVHMIALIKRIATNEIIISQAEKMSLLGRFDITSNNFLALENTHRRNMDQLEKLIKDNRGKGAKTLDQYLDETYRTDDK